eukprot:1381430-Prymnesium_polylepis.1
MGAHTPLHSPPPPPPLSLPGGQPAHLPRVVSQAKGLSARRRQAHRRGRRHPPLRPRQVRRAAACGADGGGRGAPRSSAGERVNG